MTWKVRENFKFILRLFSLTVNSIIKFILHLCAQFIDTSACFFVISDSKNGTQDYGLYWSLTQGTRNKIVCYNWTIEMSFMKINMRKYTASRYIKVPKNRMTYWITKRKWIYLEIETPILSSAISNTSKNFYVIMLSSLHIFLFFSLPVPNHDPCTRQHFFQFSPTSLLLFLTQ